MEAPVARKLREGDSVSVTPSLTKTTASPDRLWRGGFGTITFVHGNARHFNVYGADGDCYCDGRRLSPVKKGSLRVGQLVAVMNSFEGLIQILRTLLIYKGVDLRRRSLNLKEIIGMKGEIMGETATVGLFEVVLSNGRSLVLPASCLIHGESLPYQPGDAWNPCRVRITSDLDKLRRECEEAPDSWHEDLMALLVGVECIVMQHGTGQNLISVLPDPPHDGRPWVLPMSCVALVSQVQQTAAPVSTVSSTTSKKRKPRSDRSTRQIQKAAQPDDTTGSVQSRKEGGVKVDRFLGPLVSLPKPVCLPPCASPRPSHSQADPPNTQDEETHPEGGNELEAAHDGAGRNGFETNDAGAMPMPCLPGPDSHADVQSVREREMEKDDGSISEEHDERNEDEEMSEAEAADVSKNNTYVDDKDTDPRRMTSGSLHSSTFSEESKGDAVSDGQQGDMRECDQGSEGEGSEVDEPSQAGSGNQSVRSGECMSPTSEVSTAAADNKSYSCAVDPNEMDKEDESIDQEQHEDISDGQDGDVHDSHTYVRSSTLREEEEKSDAGERDQQDEYMRESEGSEDEGSDNQSLHSGGSRSPMVNVGEPREDGGASDVEVADQNDNDAFVESGADAQMLPSDWSHSRTFSEEGKDDSVCDEQQQENMRECDEGSGDDGSDNQSSHSGGSRPWKKAKHDSGEGFDDQSSRSGGSRSPKEGKHDYGAEQEDDDMHEYEGSHNQSFRSGHCMSPTRSEVGSDTYTPYSHDNDVDQSHHPIHGNSSLDFTAPSRAPDGLAHGESWGDRVLCERCEAFCERDDMIILDHCGHPMCLTCLLGYVRGALFHSNAEFQNRIDAGRACLHKGCTGVIQPGDLFRLRDLSEGMYSTSKCTMVVQETMEKIISTLEEDAKNTNTGASKMSRKRYSDGHEKEETVDSEEVENVSDYGEEVDDVDASDHSEAEYVQHVLSEFEVTEMVRRLEEADLIQPPAPFAVHHNWDPCNDDISHTEVFEFGAAGAKRSTAHDGDCQMGMESKVPRISGSEQYRQEQQPREYSKYPDHWVPTQTQARPLMAAGASPPKLQTRTGSTPLYIHPAHRNRNIGSVRSSMLSMSSHETRCEINGHTFAAKEKFKFERCGHQACMHCAVKYITDTLAHPRTYINLETARLPCPVQCCTTFMQESDIHRLQREYYVHVHGCDEPPATDEKDEQNVLGNSKQQSKGSEEVELTRKDVARLVHMLKNAREGDIDAKGNLMEPPAIPSPPVYLPMDYNTPQYADGSGSKKGRAWKNIGGGGSGAGGP